MKRGYVFAALPVLLLLLTPVGALAQVDCDTVMDQVCDRPHATPEDLVATAQAIVKVNGKPETPEYFWENVIYYWAQDGKVKLDAEGEPILDYHGNEIKELYKETVITNHNRQEMCDYLTNIFATSPDMNMVLKDERYGPDPLDPEWGNEDFIWMSTNVWSGTWSGVGTYVQEGMSVVKFEPDGAGGYKGCPYFQRDYFTEGDTWIGISQLTSFVNMFRETYLQMLAKKNNQCIDDDADGYGKYLDLATGLTPADCGIPSQAKRDCNDFDKNINPGGTEIVGNGVDDDCDGQVDETCATVPVNPERPLQLFPFFALLLLPVAFVFVSKKRLAKNLGK